MPLVDQFGREIKVETKPETRTIGAVSIRDRYSGYPAKGLTPKKLASILLAADGGDIAAQAELFEEIEEKDLHLGGIMQTRKYAVTQLDWEIKPASEDKKDQEIAAFIDETFTGLADFEDNLFDLLDGIGKGFSALENFWELRDGRHVVRHMQYVPQKKFTWVNSITPRILTEAEPIKGEELTAFKFIFHVHKTKTGDVTRQGIYRAAVWAYLFKNYSIKDWVSFAEVYGMPLRLGKYDPSASEADRNALKTAVQSLGSDAAGIISRSTEIEFVSAIQRGASSDVFEKIAKFWDTQLSKRVLGHSASADSTPGKLGNENQSMEISQSIKQADAELVTKSIRRDLICPLVGFNFGWDAQLPWLHLKYEPPEDLKSEAELYKIYLESGAEITLDEYHAKFGLGDPQNGDRLMKPRLDPAQQPGAPTAALAAKEAAVPITTQQAESPSRTQRQRLMREGLESNEKIIEAAVSDASSAYREITERIERQDDPFAVPNTPPQKLQELFYRSILAAMLNGYRRVEIEKREAPSPTGAFAQAGEIGGPITPGEAAAFWKEKIPLPYDEFKKLDDAAKVNAFSLAQQQDVYIVDKIRELFGKALTSEAGELTTVREFIKQTTDIYDRLGITELNPYHLETVFQTNMHQAYSKGREKMLDAPGMDFYFPELEFLTVDDGKVRPEHQRWHGFRAAKDNPVWNQLRALLLDYNCRCSIVGVSRYEQAAA